MANVTVADEQHSECYVDTIVLARSKSGEDSKRIELHWCNGVHMMVFNRPGELPPGKIAEAWEWCLQGEAQGRESDNLRNRLLDEVCGRLFAAGYDLVSFNSNRENPSASAHEEAYLPSLPAYQTLEDSDDENERNGDAEEDDDDDDDTVVGYEGPRTSNTEILNVTGKRKQSEQSQRRRTKKKSGKKPRKTDMPAPNPTGMSKRAQLNIHEVAKHFNKKQADAAKALDVCENTLKTFVIKHGLSRWPMRKIQSLKKDINIAKEEMEDDPGGDSQERDELLREVKRYEYTLYSFFEFDCECCERPADT